MSRISVSYAVQLLEKGELVAIPTETVYGLAARFDREESLRQIFTVKGRPFFDPLIVHVGGADQARLLTTEWPAIFDILTKAFWPGPLTLVAPRAQSVSPLITSGLDSVALRCPNHPMALKILHELNIPLAAPSANRFGHTSPTSASHVEEEFGSQIPVVDGGHCEIGVESTVIASRLTSAGKWIVEILRPGGVTRKQIADVLDREKISHAIERREAQVSPGHLKHHYQPDSPLIIVSPDADAEKILARARAQLNSSATIVNWLELSQDPRQAARALYDSFRKLSAPNAVIAVKQLPDYAAEDWEAIWDRIGRAATLKLTR